MTRIAEILGTVLRLAEVLAVIGILAASIEAVRAMRRAQTALQQATASLRQAQATLLQTQAAVANASSAIITIPRIVDGRLAAIELDTSGQLAATRAALVAEIHPVAIQAVASLAQISGSSERVSLAALPALSSVDKASADLPGLIHDARFAAARSARAMGHIEQATDAIAVATPGTAAAVEGVAVDAHRMADRLTKPKRWGQRLEGWAQIAAGIAVHVF